MNKVIQEAVIDGYDSGQNDFGTALAALPVDGQNAFEFLMTAVRESIARPDASCVVTVAGHSDRVDTAGVDRHTARAQELAASNARAESAQDFIVARIQSEIAGLPADLNDLDNFAIFFRAAGAAVLRVADANLTDAQRKQNRRVQIRAIAFVP